MAANIIADMEVRIGGNATSAKTEISALAAMMGKTGMLGLAAVAAGAVIAGVGVLATKMAGDFQTGMTSLVTGAGEAQSNLSLISSGVLQLSKDTGTSTDQLVKGLYMIESGGFHGQAGLDVLKAAAQGAKVGMADLGVVGDTVDTILKNYSDNGSLSATQATNALITTVANGKTRLEDLSASLAHVLPAGAAAGLGLKDVMGAMATLTGVGIPAADAATYLRQTIVSLEAPTAGSKKALEDIGITTQELDAKLRQGLPQALQLIRDQLDAHGLKQGSDGYVASIREISGGMRQMQGMLNLIGGEGTDQDHLKTLFADAAKVGAVATSTSGNVLGWAEVQKTFNQQVSRAGELVRTLMIELGQKLLPVATQVFSWIADNAVPTIQHFVSWISGSSTSAALLRPVLIGLSIAIAGALVASFLAWAGAAAAAAVSTIIATGPILLIGAAIALLVAGLIYAYTHWGWFKSGVDAAGHGAQVVGTLIGILTKEALKGLADMMKGPVGVALLGFRDSLGEIFGFIGNLIGKIGDLLGLLGHLKDLAGAAFTAIGSGAHAMHIPGFATGTDDAPGGLAVIGENGPELMNLPQHSRVTPLSRLGNLSPLPSGMATAGSGGSGGGSTQVNVQVDGRTLARILLPHVVANIRSGAAIRST